MFLLLRAAGCFGEAARNQRNEKTRIALLYERNFSYEGRFFVWKIFLAQTFEVALQAYGKIPFSSYLLRRLNACVRIAPRDLERLLKKFLALRSSTRS